MGRLDALGLENKDSGNMLENVNLGEHDGEDHIHTDILGVGGKSNTHGRGDDEKLDSKHEDHVHKFDGLGFVAKSLLETSLVVGERDEHIKYSMHIKILSTMKVEISKVVCCEPSCDQ